MAEGKTEREEALNTWKSTKGSRVLDVSVIVNLF